LPTSPRHWGRNTELKQFAQKTLPTLEEHQKMVLDLSRRLSQTAARQSAEQAINL
jgi:hypothetical protein